jgi:(1->4)-alpha-D-glucan 1-alpha-D-glucosylmutase
MHEEWAQRVRRWHELTGGMDDPNEEYLLWQTLVGAWPIVPGRVERYLEKALREAKRTTNWIEPNEAHERRVREVRPQPLLEPGVPRRLRAVRGRVAHGGRSTRRSARSSPLTSPGVPDLYQGDALWSLNLVDPDNRRPVNWGVHAAALRGAARRAAR